MEWSRVQEYTYLGIRITSSGTFTIAQKVLVEKALNALFKIRKQINFLRLPIRVARKIFVTASHSTNSNIRL